MNVSIPPREDQRDFITVNGPPENVKQGVEAIMAKVAEFDEEAKDKVFLLFTFFCLRFFGLWSQVWSGGGGG